MADVIRRAIIEIETRQKKSRLEAPGVSAAGGFKAEAEAAVKAEVATNSATEATKKHSEAVQASGFAMVKSFREGGEGALRMARGIALLSNSGSADLQKLVKHVALAQGAFDVFAGSFKTITNLATVMGGAAATAVTAVGAVALGVSAYFLKLKADVESSIEAVNAQIERGTKLVDAYHSRLEKIEGIGRSRSDRLINLQTTDAGRLSKTREALAQEQEISGKAIEDIAATDSDLNRPGARRRSLTAHRTVEASSDRQADLLTKIFEEEKKQAKSQQQAIAGVTNFAGVGASLGGIGGGLLAGAASVGTSRASKIENQLQIASENLERAVNKLADVATKAALRAEQLENSLNGVNVN